MTSVIWLQCQSGNQSRELRSFWDVAMSGEGKSVAQNRLLGVDRLNVLIVEGAGETLLTAKANRRKWRQTATELLPPDFVTTTNQRCSSLIAQMRNFIHLLTSEFP